MAAAASLAAAVLVACAGTASVRTSGRPPQATTSSVPGGKGSAPIDPHELEAQARAQQLLALVQPAPGWAPASGAPVSILAKPGTEPATPDLIDLARFWTTSTSWTDTYAWLQAHPPSGLTLGGTGSSGDRGGTTSRAIGWVPSTSSASLGNQVVQMNTAPLPDGGTAIRLDVQVIWVPTRPAGEVVPTGATTVQVSATWGSGARAGHLSRTFEDAATVHELASLLDGLALKGPGIGGCTMDTGLKLTLRFTGPADVPPVVAVSDPACFTTDVEIDSADQPTLRTTEELLDRETQLLGTTIAALGQRSLDANTYPAPTTTG
jgi:hypothetical protein